MKLHRLFNPPCRRRRGSVALTRAVSPAVVRMRVPRGRIGGTALPPLALPLHPPPPPAPRPRTRSAASTTTCCASATPSTAVGTAWWRSWGRVRSVGSSRCATATATHSHSPSRSFATCASIGARRRSRRRFCRFLCFALFSPTHPFLPYVAPHFFPISHIVILFSS